MAKLISSLREISAKISIALWNSVHAYFWKYGEKKSHFILKLISTERDFIGRHKFYQKSLKCLRHARNQILPTAIFFISLESINRKPLQKQRSHYNFAILEKIYICFIFFHSNAQKINHLKLTFKSLFALINL